MAVFESCSVICSIACFSNWPMVSLPGELFSEISTLASKYSKLSSSDFLAPGTFSVSKNFFPTISIMSEIPPVASKVSPGDTNVFTSDLSWPSTEG